MEQGLGREAGLGKMQPMDEVVLFERRGHSAIFTMNPPRQRNSVNPELSRTAIGAVAAI